MDNDRGSKPRKKNLESLVWLLAVTWKRRKGQPREYIAVCNGGVLQILFFHKHLYESMKVPGSWIDFKLHTRSEFRKLAPHLHKQFIEKHGAKR